MCICDAHKIYFVSYLFLFFNSTLVMCVGKDVSLISSHSDV